jgi:hypothetical protein
MFLVIRDKYSTMVKCQVKNMNLLKITFQIGIILFASLVFAIGYKLGSFNRESQEKYIYDQVCELQMRVGAKVDGKIGEETIRLVNQAIEGEKQERFNNYTVPYFEEKK